MMKLLFALASGGYVDASSDKDVDTKDTTDTPKASPGSHSIIHPLIVVAAKHAGILPLFARSDQMFQLRGISALL